MDFVLHTSVLLQAVIIQLVMIRINLHKLFISSVFTKCPLLILCDRSFVSTNLQRIIWLSTNSKPVTGAEHVSDPFLFIINESQCHFCLPGHNALAVFSKMQTVHILEAEVWQGQISNLCCTISYSVTPPPSVLYLVNTVCLARWRGHNEGGEAQTRGGERHKLWFKNMQELVCVHIGFNLKCNSL